MFFKSSVPGFTISTPGKLLSRMSGLSSSNILASCSDNPPLGIKYQQRVSRVDISSSNIHVKFPVDPGKKINFVPSADETIRLE